MPAVETHALTKRFGDVVAVDGLDLTVREGEVFGFLGPNGAGKSTTIDVLLDFARPTSGSAEVLGIDPQADPEAVRDRVGVLPEGFDLYDRLSGRTHVAFAVDAKDAAGDPADLLDRVGLDEDDWDRPAGTYSTGMTQRLALAMALAGRPDLLILDEPSTGLDPVGMREIREVVRAEVGRGATVFFSSHVLSQVESVCDRVGIMNEGRLAAVDTIQGLREAAGVASTFELSVDRTPRSLSLDGLQGIERATVENGTVRVACTDPAVKSEVVRRVEAAGAPVTDVTSVDVSLEELFAAYTTDGAGREVSA